LKGIAFFAEIVKEMFRVNYVAIMGYGDIIIIGADDYGLSITDATGTSGGVAVMTYGDIPGELT
jgi:hypothetical protein